ncbi:MAG: DivIVA domain-containing protein [Candidatus Nanopelagicales bacterium]
MIVFFVLIGLSVIGALGLLMRRDRPLLSDDPIAGRPFKWPAEGALTAESLRAVRFPVALRGYRMAQVDAVLADCAAALAQNDAALAERDAEIARLGAGTRPIPAEIGR